jgi:hypothetical protein
MTDPSEVRSTFASYIDTLLAKGVLEKRHLKGFRAKLVNTDEVTVENLLPEREAAARNAKLEARKRLDQLLNDPAVQQDPDWLRNFLDVTIKRLELKDIEQSEVRNETTWLPIVRELVEAAGEIDAKFVLLQSGSHVDPHLADGLREHNLAVARQVGPGQAEYRLIAAPEQLSVEGQGEVAIRQFLVARISTEKVVRRDPGAHSAQLTFSQAVLGLDFSDSDTRARSHVQLHVTNGRGVRFKLTARAPTPEVLMNQHTKASLRVAAIFSALCLAFGLIAGLALRHESLLYLGLVAALIGLPAVYVVVHQDLHADPNIRNLPPLSATQPKYDLEADKYVFEQERARVAAYVGGIATAAAGFIATLVVALLKGEVSRSISPWWPAGALIGAVVLVGYALFLSLTLRPLNRRFSERHPQ